MEKARKTNEMDMLSGGLAGKLILFEVPLAFSSILQQLFNSADVAVVGRFAGDKALAAVGSCVALVGIFVNLNVGLSVGPNAVLANLIGQKKRDKINSMLHTILTFGIILGVILMFIGMLSAKVVLELSGTPESVLDEVLLYIRIYFISIPFMVIYNFGSAILRSYGDSRRPMYYLVISGVVNVVLNLFLVICFHLGVVGVAGATLISNILSAGLVIVHLYRRDDEFGFRFRRMHIEGQKMYQLLEDILAELTIVKAIALITAPPTAEERKIYPSMHFHEKMGYHMIGRIEKSGYKFNRWYDTMLMDKMIGEPKEDMEEIKTFDEVRAEFQL